MPFFVIYTFASICLIFAWLSDETCIFHPSSMTNLKCLKVFYVPIRSYRMSARNERKKNRWTKPDLWVSSICGITDTKRFGAMFYYHYYVAQEASMQTTCSIYSNGKRNTEKLPYRNCHAARWLLKFADLYGCAIKNGIEDELKR